VTPARAPNTPLNVQEVLSRDGASPRQWWRRPIIRWSLVVTAALFLIFISWSISLSGSAPRYLTETVTRGDLTVIVTATGSVQPTKKVDVSSELSGMVREVHVDYNTPVKVGQVLAELDLDKLKASVDAVRAKVTAAEANVAEAKATVTEKDRDYARKQALAAKQVVSEYELDAAVATRDRAVAAVASAEAAVASAEADLKLAETNLAKTCICSPIDGVVLARNVDPGQTVASSFQAPVLFEIAEDLRQMELQVDVDEADVGAVKAGQAASFTVDTYPDREFPAKVSTVRFASEVVQGVVTYKAVLAIENADLLLRPGMTATAEIKVQEMRDVLLVPNAALRYSPVEANQGDQRSFLERLMPGPPRVSRTERPQMTGRTRTVHILRDRALVAVDIEIGSTDGRLTEIASGELKAGDQIIIGQQTAGS